MQATSRGLDANMVNTYTSSCYYILIYCYFMAHTKAGGSTSLGRDSQAKRLGVKLFAGQPARAGMVIVKQRGTKFFPGDGVKKGNDDTLFAARAGTVQFLKKWRRSYTGKLKLAKVVTVVPLEKAGN